LVYNTVLIPVNVAVAPKDITITGFDISKIYDGDDTVRNFGAITLEGLVGSETATVNTSNIVARYTSSDYGTHDVTFSGNFAVLGSGGNPAIPSNYVIKLPIGIRGNIEQRPLKINFDITKVYDGHAEVTNLGTLTFNNLVVGQTATVIASNVSATYAQAHVGTDIDITFTEGEFSMNTGGTANPNNYSVIQPTNEVTGTITARPLTIFPNAGQRKVFGTADPLPFSFTQSEELIAGNTFSGGLGRDTGENVFAYPFTIGTLSAGHNYSLHVGGNETFEIIPANPVLTGFPTHLAAVYGDSLKHIDLVAHLTAEHTPGTFQWVLGPDRPIGWVTTRSFVFEFIPTDGHNFNRKTDSVYLTSIPKPITWNNDGRTESKEYDGTASATVLVMPTLNGVLLSDTGNVDVPVGSVRFADSNANLSVTVIAENWRINGPLSNRYTISGQPEFEKGVITPKPLTVTGSGITKIYDGHPTVEGGFGSFAFNGFVGHQTASVNAFGITGATYASPDFGSHIITFAGNFALNTDGTANPNNYVVTHPIGIRGNITRRELTITGSGISKIYDGNNSVVNGFGNLAFVGLIGDETATVNTSSITNATYAFPNFGSHTIRFFGNFAMTEGTAKAANYVIAHPTGISGVIEKKPVTIKFDITKNYDGNNEVTDFGILTFNGLVGAQTASVDISNSSAIYTDVNAGTEINIVFEDFNFSMNADGTADTNNYVVMPSSVTGIIMPRPLMIVPDFGQYKRHGQDDPDTFSFTQSEDLIAGNHFTGKLGRAGDDNIGVYPFTLGTLSAGNNYVLDLGGNARFEIIDAYLELPEIPIRLTAIYGQRLSDIRIDTLLTDEHPAGVLTWMQDTNELVGEVTVDLYPRIRFSLWFQPEDDERFNPTIVSVALTVIPKPLMWSTDGTVFAKTYDGHTDATVDNEPTLIGVLPNDMSHVSIIAGTVHFADSNAHTTVNVIAKDWDIDGVLSLNYSIPEQPMFVSQAINKRELTIKAEGISKVYDGNDDVIYTSDNLSFIGLIGDETATVDISGVSGTYDSPNFGTHGITFNDDLEMMFEGGTANPHNYEIIHPIGIKGDITKKELTISGFDISKTYDGDEVVKNGFGTLIFVGLVGDQTAEVNEAGVSATYFSSDFGTHDITFLGDFGMLFGSADWANYNIIHPTDVSGNIEKREIEITPDAGQNKVYGELDPKFSFTESETLIAGNTFGGSLEREEGDTVGMYLFMLGTLDAGENYTLTFIEGETFEIIQADPVLPDFLALSAVYGETLDDINILDLLTNGIHTSGDFSWEQSLDTDVGTVLSPTDHLSLRFTPSDEHNFTQATIPIVLTVMPKLLTWTDGTVEDKTYDGHTAATVDVEPTLLGILNDDVVEISVGTVDFEFPDVGNHPVFAENWDIEGDDASNYDINQQPIFAFGTIHQREIYLTDFDLSKIYDGNHEVTNFGAELSFINLVDDETATVNTSDVTATYDQIDVGININITFNGDFEMTEGTAKASNYSIVQPTILEGQITPRELTLSGFTISKIYDGDDVVIDDFSTLVFVGFANDESADVDVIGVVATYAQADAGTNINITFDRNFEMMGGTADPDNYSIIQPTVTGTITPKSLTISPNAGQNKVFGESDPVFAYTNETLIAGNFLIGELERVLGENVGTYPFTIGSLSAGSNYTLTLNGEVFRIIPTNPVVPPFIVLSAVYGQTLDEIDLLPLLSEINLTGSLVWKQPALSLVGLATPEGDTRDEFSLVFTPDNLNFNPIEIPVVLTVARKPLTWNAIGTVNSKIYDGTRNATVQTEPTLNGVLSSDMDEITVRCTVRFSSANVGNNHSVVVDNWIIEGSAVSNYEFPTTNPSFRLGSITRRPITIENFDITKVYDGDQGVTGGFGVLSFAGLVEGEAADVNATNILNPTYSSSDVGTHEISYSGNFTMSGASSNNYTIIQPTILQGEITPRELTIEADGISKIYDGDNTVTNFGMLTFAGFIEGETASVDITEVSATYESKDFGTHRITFSENFALTGGNAKTINYKIVYPTEIEGDITKKDLTLFGFDISKIYDGNTTVEGGLGTLSFVGFIGDETAEVDTTGVVGATYFSPDFGIHNITFIGSFGMLDGSADWDNYRIIHPTNVNGNIEKREVEITPDAGQNKAYGELDPEFSFTESETLIAGNTFTGSLEREEGEEVGTYLFTLGTLLAGENYTLTLIAGETFEILQATSILPEPLFLSAVYGQTLGDVRIDKLLTDGIHTPGTFAWIQELDTDVGTVLNPTDNLSLKFTPTDDHNFRDATVSVILTVTPALLTWTDGTVKNKIYDGSTVAEVLEEPVLSGILNDDMVSVKSGTVDFEFPNANIDVGVIAAGWNIEGDDASNYKIDEQPSFETGTINPKTLTILGFDISKIYDGEHDVINGFGTLIFDGLVAGETATVDVSDVTAIYAFRDFGTHDITFDGEFEMSESGENPANPNNYKITQPTDVQGDITKRELTIEGYGISKVYDGDVEVINGLGVLFFVGFVDGETATVDTSDITNATFASRNFGTRVITFAGEFDMIDGNANPDNYKIIHPNNITGRIEKRELTILFSNITKIYDGNNQVTNFGTPTFENLVDGEIATVNMSNASAIYADVNVETGIDITFTEESYFSMNVGGTANSNNYDIIQPTNDVTGAITRRPLTIFPDHGQNKKYEDPDPLPFSYTMSEVLIPGNDTTGGLGRILGENVGTYAFTLGNLSAGNNYTLALGGIARFEITLGGLDLPASPIRLTAVYGETLNDIRIDTLLTDGIHTSGTFTWIENPITHVGTVTAEHYPREDFSLEFTPSDYPNIRKDTVSVALTVTPKLLTWSTNGTVKDKIYDGNTLAEVATEPTLNGILFSDNVEVELGSTHFADVNVGIHEVNALNWGIKGDDAFNYRIEQQPKFADEAITPKTLTISGFNILKNYDGDNVVLNGFGELLFVGLVGSETAMVDDSDVTATYEEIVFGVHTITFDGDFGMTEGSAIATNYIITQPTDILGRIEKRTLTWNAEGTAETKIYDGTKVADVATLPTLFEIVVGDDVNVVATIEFSNSNASENASVIVTSWNVEGDDVDNYEISGNPTFSTGIIHPKTLTWDTEGTVDTKIYDGTKIADVATLPTLFEVVSGDDVNVVATVEFVDVNVSTNASVIVTNWRVEGDDVDNYVIEGNPTFSAGAITKKWLTWNTSGTVKPKTYDRTTDVEVDDLPTLFGIIAGDDVNVIATAAFTNSSANESASVNVLSWSVVGNDADNYQIQGQPTFSNGIINRKPLSWIINGSVNTKTYNGNTNATLQTQNRPTLSGVLNDDVAGVNVVVGTIRFEFPNANPTASVIAENWAIGGIFAHNYIISTQPEFPTVEISRRAITLAGLNITKTYDGDDSVRNFGNLSFANLVSGETANVDISGVTATYEQTIFGTHNITFNGNFAMTGGTANSGNYLITQPTGITGRIEPREIIITPIIGQSKVFGEDDPEFLFTTNEDLIIGNTFTGSLGRAPGNTVGTYQLVPGDLAAGDNYELIFTEEEITFEITKKPIAMPTVIEGLIYTGTSQTGILQNDHATYYTVTGSSRTNAGNYIATVVLRDHHNTEWTDKTTDNLLLNWSIGKRDSLAPQSPQDLMAVVGELVSTVVLPVHWTWQSPNDYVGEAGVQTHYANYNPDPQNFNTHDSVEVEILVTDHRIDLSDANPTPRGLGWTYDLATEVYTITGTNAVNVIGNNNSSQRRIGVANNATVTINFNNVDISGLGDGLSAISLGNNTTATLDFIGKNGLEGGTNGSGISGGTVIINKGVVTATGKNGKHGIDAILRMEGDAIVFASSVSDLNEKTSGILVVSDNTNWYGNADFTLSQNVTIPADYTLTIPNLHTLTIPDFTTLTNNGTVIENCGSLIVQTDGVFVGNPIAVMPICMSGRLLDTLAIDRLIATYGDKMNEISLPENWYWMGDTDRFVGDASVDGSTYGAFVRFVSPNPIYSDVTDIPADVFVLQKELRINVADFDISKTYDGNTTVEGDFGNLTFAGLVRSETAVVNTSNVTATYALADFGTHNITFIGDFEMMIGGGTAKPSNYKISQPTNVEGTITKKELTLAGFDITKIYDGNTTVEGGFGTLTFEGLVGDQTANVNISGVSATYDLPDYGIHNIVFAGDFTMTDGTANPSNYEITHPIDITGSVTKKELTITGSDISKTYDGNNVVDGYGTFGFVGLVDDETATVDTFGIISATYVSPDYGTHLVVFNGNFAMTEGTAKASNYTITHPIDIRGDIEKKPITIDFNITKIYDGHNQVTSFGTPRFVDLVGGQNATVNSLGVMATYMQTDVGDNIGVEFTEGSFSMNVGGSANPNNYTIIQPINEVTGTITRRTLTITPSAGQTKKFGENDPVLTYTSAALIAGNTFVGALGRAPGENVGEYAINLGNLNAGNNYNVILSGNTRFFEITPANPVLPESIALTAVYGDSLSHIDISSLLTGMHTPGNFVWTQTNRPVGTVTPEHFPRRNFTLRFLPTQAQNFNSVIVEVALTVTPKPLSWNTSGTVYPKNYDGTRNAQVHTQPTLSGVLSSDLSSVSVRAGMVRFADSNANPNVSVSAVNWGIVGDNAFNYEIIGQPVFENETINPKPITITGSGITKIYDGDDEVKGSLGSFAFTGLVTGERANVDASAITGAIYELRDFGTHNITFNGNFAMTGIGANPAMASNYDIIHPTEIKGDITKRELAIDGNGISKIYDGNTNVEGGFGTLTFIGLVGGETATVNTSSITNATYESSNFGTYHITFTGNFAMTESTAKAINYDIIHPTHIYGDIEKRALTWSSEGTVNERNYNGTTNATVATLPTLSEIVADEDVRVTASVRFADSKANPNVNIVVTSWNVGGNDVDNYEIVGEPTFADGTINRRTLTWNVAGTVHEKDYDGTTVAEVATLPRLSGLISGDDVRVSTSVEFENSNAGTNIGIIVKNWSIEGNDTSNYRIDGQPVFSTGTIYKRALTWLSNGTVYRKDYDGTTDAEIATLPILFGIATDDDVNVNISVRFADANANQIANVVVTDWSVEGTDADNYVVHVVPRFSAGRIERKAITIIPHIGQRKVFGETDPQEFLYGNTDLIGDDSIIGNLGREEGEDVGIYLFNIGTLTAGNNYTLALFGNVTFEITQADPDFGFDFSVPLSATYGHILSDIDLSELSSQTETYGDILSRISLLSSSQTQTEGVFSWEQPLHTDVGTVAIPRNNLTLKFTPSSTNFKIVENIPVTMTVFPKFISWNTIDEEDNHGTVEEKDYDGTTNATITTLPTLSGIINDDNVNVVATVQFADIHANESVNIIVTNWNIEGVDAGNYQLSEEPKFSAATINQRLIRIVGFDIYKEYDGTTDLVGGYGPIVFEGLIEGETADVCTQNVVASYASPEVGTHLKIFDGFFGMIDGTAVATNYSIEHPTDVTGVIAPRSGVEHTYQSRIEMKVYPNPVDRGNLIWLEVDADTDFLEGTEIDVYNSFGVRVDVIRVQGRQTAIESSRLKPGLYIVVFRGKNGFRQETKLIVK
jgi:hypothetical protein